MLKASTSYYHDLTASMTLSTGSFPRKLRTLQWKRFSDRKTSSEDKMTDRKPKSKKKKSRKSFLPPITNVGQQADEVKEEGRAMPPLKDNTDKSITGEKVPTIYPSGEEEAEPEDTEILPSICLSGKSSFLAV